MRKRLRSSVLNKSRKPSFIQTCDEKKFFGKSVRMRSQEVIKRKIKMVGLHHEDGGE